MKARFLAATLALLVVLVVGAVAQVPGETGLPAAARARLDSYVAFRYGVDGASIGAVARARAPWNLTQDRGGRVYGESVRFPSDYGPGWRADAGSSHLPFPPKELWCVSLAAGVSSGSARGIPSHEIVLVGLYLDMYNGDWLVHLWPDELPRGGSPKVAEADGAAAAVGCGSGRDTAGAADLVP